MLTSRRGERALDGCRLVRKRTFCSIACFVIFGKPLQILVFDPRDPIIVLAVVKLASLLFICLALRILAVACHYNEFWSLYVRNIGRC